MRIISGSARGRRLKVPKGQALRPTAARVKEALFDILSHDLSGLKVLDLFAGTGSLSLEALSRGAEEVVLVDASRHAVQAIRDNLRRLGLTERASIWPVPVLQGLRALARKRKKFHLIFLDPPYERGIVKSTLRALGEKDLLEGDGLVILEHSVREEIDRAYGNLALREQRRYGTTMLSFFAPRPAQQSD
jgi:16S rRNA (guanine(966)-N(2))-methyltransferase RsmD